MIFDVPIMYYTFLKQQLFSNQYILVVVLYISTVVAFDIIFCIREHPFNLKEGGGGYVFFPIQIIYFALRSSGNLFRDIVNFLQFFFKGIKCFQNMFVPMPETENNFPSNLLTNLFPRKT